MSNPTATTPFFRRNVISERDGNRRALSRLHRAIASIGVCAAAILQIGCSSDAPTGAGQVATSISISPNGITIDALGATQGFQAVVLDANGTPIPGLTIQWSTQPATIANVTSNGTVTAQSNGATQLTAKFGSLETSVPLTVQQQANSLQKVSGDNQQGSAGAQLPNPLRVRVLDRMNSPVAGVVVQFSVSAGDGSLTTTSAATDASGDVTTQLTVGPTTGLNQVRAEVTGIPVATFSATGTPVPTAMVVHTGNGQTATVGTQVGTAPAVRVTGAGLVPVPGVPVTFSVTDGGGSINGVTVNTDANGVAAVGSWTLGTAAGSNTLQANAASLTAVNFSATGSAGNAATITIQAGNNQTAPSGGQVAIDPAAIVRDAFANPVSGVTVTFAVTAGGGSVGGATPSTSALGIATVGSWTLGPGANSLSATASGSGIQGNPLSFSATGSISLFNIELRYLTGVTPSQQTAFNNAVAKWQSIITGDLSTVNANVGAGQCGTNSPAVNEQIDDMVVFVTLESIDGSGGVLGSAGPCWIRSAGANYHPFLGRMRFDVADLAMLEGNGSLEAVILHEMGHVLGIGTLWGPSQHNLLVNPSLPSSPGVDTHFNGTNAIAAFNTIGGGSYVGAKVPVENSQGGSGTRDAHWRESVMQNELMTGFLSMSSNPLSLVTVRALQDLGYVVNASAADTYTLPGGGQLMLDPGPMIHLIGDLTGDPIRIGG